MVTRTAATWGAGSGHRFRICLDDTACHELDNFDPDYTRHLPYHPGDLERGAIDHYRFTAPLPERGPAHVALETSARWPNGRNVWAPSCVAVVLDGELVYCRDDFEAQAVEIGTDAGAQTRWVDPDPRHRACQGCYPSPVTHGPMVGRTTPSSARIWLRTTASWPVQVRHARRADMRGARTTSPIVPSVAEDFVAEVVLDALPAGTETFYEVLVGGQPIAPPGTRPRSFRTAPVAGARFTAAVGSCVRYSLDPNEPIFGTIRQADPDLLLMVGDNHYGNSADPTISTFHYMRERSVSTFADLTAHTPTWAIWDDHDFGPNNAVGATTPGRGASLAVFQRFWPNGAFGSDGARGIWSSFEWGDVAFFLLDTRYHRDQPSRHADGSMLGGVQAQWLRDALEASSATFKVLISGSQWSLDGSRDSWRMARSERRELFGFIERKGISGVFLVSGDVHRSEVRVLNRTPRGYDHSQDDVPAAYDLYEVTSSPLQSSHRKCERAQVRADQRLMCAGRDWMFVLLHFDTAAETPSVTFDIRNLAGRSLYRHTVTIDELTANR